VQQALREAFSVWGRPQWIRVDDGKPCGSRNDLPTALVDSASLRAPSGGAKTGPNPTDRRKPGSKHHLLTDAHGVPLAFSLTGANRHDVTQLLPLLDKVPPVRGKRGAPRSRPDRVQGDRAYDSEPLRRSLKKRG
jgi:hypothetical protein